LQNWRTTVSFDAVGIFVFFMTCRVAGFHKISNHFLSIPVGWLIAMLLRIHLVWESTAKYFYDLQPSFHS
jgi:hypothetical protein